MSIKNLDFSRIIFYIAVFIVVVALSFSYGLYSATSNNWAFRTAKSLKSDIKIVLEESDRIFNSNPKHFLQPAHHNGSGVTINDKDNDQDDLILLSGFFDDNNEIRLIRRNGDIVARWTVKFSEIFPDTSYLQEPPATDWNIDLHGTVALPDGSVVFNFEYAGLVKLNRCGDVVWKLDTRSHHSIDLAEDGGFWVPGRNFYDKGEVSHFQPFFPPFKEDTILKVSANGRLISEISVPKLLYDNDLKSLLTASGEFFNLRRRWDNEIVHLNKVAVLKSDIADDFPQFKAGDLMLSLRMYNMILVVDPEIKTVKWWKIGPWERQHDPEFIAGGKIIVFNNNTYTTDFGSSSYLSSPDSPRVSNIIEFDPLTDKHKILYGEKSGQELMTKYRGKHELMPHGGLLITESEAGRVLETDVDGQVIWEYINRYNQDEVAEITEARAYQENYFKLKNWSCEIDTIK